MDVGTYEMVNNCMQIDFKPPFKGQEKRNIFKSAPKP